MHMPNTLLRDNITLSTCPPGFIAWRNKLLELSGGELVAKVSAAPKLKAMVPAFFCHLDRELISPIAKVVTGGMGSQSPESSVSNLCVLCVALSTS